MGQETYEKFREVLGNFLDASPHGTKAKLSRESGVTAETIDRFLAGNDIYEKTFKKLKSAMPEIVHTGDEQRHWEIVADDLQVLVDLLRSNAPGDRKAKMLASKVGFYNAEIEAGVLQGDEGAD